ncbi:MAG: hypothetical protein IJ265_00680 [Oscillospiraceae bacterium]|nr:hypothetical protein [Oscillospiraceae bacterium]
MNQKQKIVIIVAGAVIMVICGIGLVPDCSLLMGAVQRMTNMMPVTIVTILYRREPRRYLRLRWGL